MKLDRSNWKKSLSEVPVEIQRIIEEVRSCDEQDLFSVLSRYERKSFIECDLAHFADVLDRFDALLEQAAERTADSEWALQIEQPNRENNLRTILAVLRFTDRVIENATRDRKSDRDDQYSSLDRIVALLAVASNCDLVVALLNTLYVVTRRFERLARNFRTEKKESIVDVLSLLIEGCSFRNQQASIVQCCARVEREGPAPRFATVHIEYQYDSDSEAQIEPPASADANVTASASESKKQVASSSKPKLVHQVHINVWHKMLRESGFREPAASLMRAVLTRANVPRGKWAALFAALRTAYWLTEERERRRAAEVRLLALATHALLDASTCFTKYITPALHTDLLELFALEVTDCADQIGAVRCAAIRLVNALVIVSPSSRHASSNSAMRLPQLIESLQLAAYHGAVGKYARTCLQQVVETDSASLSAAGSDSSVHPLPLRLRQARVLVELARALSATSLGSDSLRQSNVADAVIKLLNWHLDSTAQTDAFWSDAVRNGGLSLESATLNDASPQTGTSEWVATGNDWLTTVHLELVAAAVDVVVTLMRHDGQFVVQRGSIGLSISRLEAEVVASRHNLTVRAAEGTPTRRCDASRLSVISKLLSLVQVAMDSPAFADQVRHLMDGSLPGAIRHIVSNVEYYGAPLFASANRVLSEFVNHEPSSLSALQDAGVTDTVLEALLVKPLPAASAVLHQLPTILSALCLNQRGLDAFMRLRPFERLFAVLLSPPHVSVLRRKNSDSMQTVQLLGFAVDQLAKHQPSIRNEATRAVVSVLRRLVRLANWPLTAGDNASLNATQPQSGGDVTMADSTEAAAEDAIPTEAMLRCVPEFTSNLIRFIEAVFNPPNGGASGQPPTPSAVEAYREFVKEGLVEPLLSLAGLRRVPLDFFAQSRDVDRLSNAVRTLFSATRDPEVLRLTVGSFRTALGSVCESLGSTSDISCESRLLEEFIAALRRADAESENDADSVRRVLDGREHTRHEVPTLDRLATLSAYTTVLDTICRASNADVKALVGANLQTELESLDRLDSVYQSLVRELAVLNAVACQLDVSASSVERPEYLRRLEEALQRSITDSQQRIERMRSAVSMLVGVCERLATAIHTLFVDMVRLSGSLANGSQRQRERQRYGLPPPLPPPVSAQQSAHAQAIVSRVANCLGSLLRASTERLPSDGVLRKRGVARRVATLNFIVSLLIDAPSERSGDRSNSRCLVHALAQRLAYAGSLDALLDTLRVFLDELGDSSDAETDEDLGAELNLFVETYLRMLTQLCDAAVVLEPISAVVAASERDRPRTIGGDWRSRPMASASTPAPSNSSASQNASASAAEGSESKPSAPYNSMALLTAFHREALSAINILWTRANGRFWRALNATNVELAFGVLTHLITGTRTLRERIKLLREAAASSSNSAAAQASAAEEAEQRRRVEQQAANLQTLMEMGFVREHCLEALQHHSTVEVAAQWLIENPRPLPVSTGAVLSEEEQLEQAIALSLNDNGTTEPASAAAASSTGGDRTAATSEIVVEEQSRFAAMLRELDALSIADANSHVRNLHAFLDTNLTGMCITLVDTQPDSLFRVAEILNEAMRQARELTDADATDAESETDSARSSIVTEWPISQNEATTRRRTVPERARIEAEFAADALQYRVLRRLAEDARRAFESQDNNSADVLRTRLHCLALLFTHMPLDCALFASRTDLLDLLFSLLDRFLNEHRLPVATQQSQNQEDASKVASAASSCSSRWIVLVLLLLDSYERACASAAYRKSFDALRDPSVRRTWFWLDDARRWSPYHAAVQRTLDDAFARGDRQVAFRIPSQSHHRAAFAPHYRVSFDTMTQLNLETENKRDIIFTIDKQSTPTSGTAKPSETGTTDSTPVDQMSFGLPPTDGDGHPARLTRTQAENALRAVLAVLDDESVAPELANAALRLAVRLTRGSFALSTYFESLGGSKRLLRLRAGSFRGSAALVTLLLRHTMEDERTLRAAIERMIRASAHPVAATTVAQFAGERVASQQRKQYRDLHTTMRQLAPLACRDFSVFTASARDLLRPHVDPDRLRQEVARQPAAHATFAIDCAPPPPPLPVPPSTSAPQQQQLLSTPQSASGSKPARKSGSVSPHKSHRHTSASAGTASTPSGLDLDQEELIRVLLHMLIEVREESASGEASSPSATALDTLLTRATVLRILCELAKCYPNVAAYIASYQFTVAQPPARGTLLRDDRSALAVVFDFFVPLNALGAVSEEELRAYSEPLATLYRAVATPDQRTAISLAAEALICIVAHATGAQAAGSAAQQAETQARVVSELKLALQRAAALEESPIKHAYMRALADLLAGLLGCCEAYASVDAAAARRGGTRLLSVANGTLHLHPLVKLLFRRGIHTDLAGLVRCLPLGSSLLPATLNRLLEPLDTLTRVLQAAVDYASAQQRAASQRGAVGTSATIASAHRPSAGAGQSQPSATGRTARTTVRPQQRVQSEVDADGQLESAQPVASAFSDEPLAVPHATSTTVVESAPIATAATRTVIMCGSNTGSRSVGVTANASTSVASNTPGGITTVEGPRANSDANVTGVADAEQHAMDVDRVQSDNRQQTDTIQSLTVVGRSAAAFRAASGLGPLADDFEFDPDEVASSNEDGPLVSLRPGDATRATHRAATRRHRRRTDTTASTSTGGDAAEAVDEDDDEDDEEIDEVALEHDGEVEVEEGADDDDDEAPRDGAQHAEEDGYDDEDDDDDEEEDQDVDDEEDEDADGDGHPDEDDEPDDDDEAADADEPDADGDDDDNLRHARPGELIGDVELFGDPLRDLLFRRRPPRGILFGAPAATATTPSSGAGHAYRSVPLLHPLLTRAGSRTSNGGASNVPSTGVAAAAPSLQIPIDARITLEPTAARRSRHVRTAAVRIQVQVRDRDSDTRPLVPTSAMLSRLTAAERTPAPTPVAANPQNTANQAALAGLSTRLVRRMVEQWPVVGDEMVAHDIQRALLGAINELAAAHARSDTLALVDFEHGNDADDEHDEAARFVDPEDGPAELDYDEAADEIPFGFADEAEPGLHFGASALPQAANGIYQSNSNGDAGGAREVDAVLAELRDLPGSYRRWSDEAKLLDGDDLGVVGTLAKLSVLHELERQREDLVAAERKRIEEERARRNDDGVLKELEARSSVRRIDATGVDNAMVTTASASTTTLASALSEHLYPPPDSTESATERRLNEQSSFAAVTEQDAAPQMPPPPASAGATSITPDSQSQVTLDSSTPPSSAEPPVAASGVQALSLPAAFTEPASSDVTDREAMEQPSSVSESQEVSSTQHADFESAASLGTNESTQMLVDETIRPASDAAAGMDPTVATISATLATTEATTSTIIPLPTGEAVSTMHVAESSADAAQQQQQSAGDGELDEIDPSFLEALPEDIRREVIANHEEQRRRRRAAQQARAQPATSAAGSSAQATASVVEVNAEFLAALPVPIQEEVLAYQRAEQARLAARNASAAGAAARQPADVDPATVLSMLAPDLRRQVLADLDDSQLAALPNDMRREATSLRMEIAAEQQRRFAEHDRILQSQLRTFVNASNRPRHSRRMRDAERDAAALFFDPLGVGAMRYDLLGQVDDEAPNAMRVHVAGPGSSRRADTFSSTPSAGAQPDALLAKLFKSRSVFDADSVACLLLVLFLDDSRIQFGSLRRILRNLAESPATRRWLLRTCLAILEKCADADTSRTQTANAANSFSDSSSAMTYTEDWMQCESHATTTAWLTNVGEAGSSSVFELAPIDPSKPRAASASQRITIEPRAAHTVLRNVLEALLGLAKPFGDSFLPRGSSRNDDDESDAPRKDARKDKKREAGGRDVKKDETADDDFWHLLLNMTASSGASHVGQTQGQVSVAAAATGSPMEVDAGNSNQSAASAASAMSVEPDLAAADSELLRGFDEAMLHELDSDEFVRAYPSSTFARLLALVGAPAVRRDAAVCDLLFKLLAQIAQTNVIQNAMASFATGHQSKPTSSSSDQMDTDATEADAGGADARSRQPIVSHATRVLLRDVRTAIEILTSKACSEDGLADATTLLQNVGRAAPHLRSAIVIDLLYGARQLGLQVASNLRALRTEVGDHVDTSRRVAGGVSTTDLASMAGASSSTGVSSLRGTLQDRFEESNVVVVSGPLRVRPSDELRIPSMALFSGRNSAQNYLLRLINVILALLNERDATTQSSDGASEQRAALSRRLQLDELWDVLGDCIASLDSTNDPLAVLLLQPTVEAFFLVHADPNSADAARSRNRRALSARDREPREDPKAKAHEIVNAALAVFEAVATSVTKQSDSTVVQPTTGTESAAPPPHGRHSPEATQSQLATTTATATTTPKTSVIGSDDMNKFLRFAETHRRVLNQILRQSKGRLSEGTFACLVEHTRILDFDIKRRHFRAELERYDDVRRYEDTYLRVPRERVLQESFRQLNRKSMDEWKGRFVIHFDGEEGQDAGGLLREWYMVMSRDIFNPGYALFKTAAGNRNTYTINPKSDVNTEHLDFFKFIGMFIAKAIYDNKLLECYFTRAFYKHILGVPVKHNDMENEDNELYKGLVFLLENDIELLGYEQTFTLENREFGTSETIELIPSGKSILVTNENKQDYVKLVCQEKMTRAVRDQLKAFLTGFYSIIPHRLISIFNEQELELLISGLPQIDVDDLKANTEYRRYKPDSMQIKWFWRALKSFDQADRARFLQFVTGTSRVPLAGFAHLEGMNGPQKFTIQRDDRSTDRLPCAHTCFNQLDLPLYDSYEKLRTMLLKAVNECSEGFGFA